jgi:hypothetical protein
MLLLLSQQRMRLLLGIAMLQRVAWSLLLLGSAMLLMHVGWSDSVAAVSPQRMQRMHLGTRTCSLTRSVRVCVGTGPQFAYTNGSTVTHPPAPASLYRTGTPMPYACEATRTWNCKLRCSLLSCVGAHAQLEHPNITTLTRTLQPPLRPASRRYMYTTGSEVAKVAKQSNPCKSGLETPIWQSVCDWECIRYQSHRCIGMPRNGTDRATSMLHFYLWVYPMYPLQCFRLQCCRAASACVVSNGLREWHTYLRVWRVRIARREARCVPTDGASSAGRWYRAERPHKPSHQGAQPQSARGV